MSRDVLSFAAVDWRRLPGKLLLVALVGAAIALVLEPDHSSGLPLLAAFGLWATHIFTGTMLFLLALETARHCRLDGLPAIILSIALLPLLFAPVSLLLDVGFGRPDGELAAGVGVLRLYLGEVTAVAPVAVTMGLVVSALLYRGRRERESGRERDPETAPLAADAAPLRQTPGDEDEIIHLQAQDHYVEVVRVNGRALRTARFADCVAELAALDGLQCHRSHWVNLRHVRSLRRAGSAYLCTLSNGEDVPVSRRRHGELKRRLAERIPDAPPPPATDP